MKITIKHLVNDIATPEGFPVVVKVSNGQDRKQKQICFAKINQFSENDETVNSKHPDYEIIAPMIMNLKIRARKVLLQKYISSQKALDALFEVDFSGISFQDFGAELLADMEKMKSLHEKNKDIISRNKIAGNIKVYSNVLAQFAIVIPVVVLADLDYNILTRFKNYQIGLGNKKNTVHLYLRTLRAIYNKGCLKYNLPDKKPFKGVFDGLKQKSYENKKKYVTKESIALIEQFDFKTVNQKYVDLFLLQFYLGGADLIDIYYLKKMHYRRGRIFFERGKLGTGLMLDLVVHPKAEAIMKKYPSEDEWLFPWRKDKLGYENFRGCYLRVLNKMVDQINESEKQKKVIDCDYEQKLIEVLPLGGNLGVKVTRHTFANIAKNLMLDPDLIRELMGHERDDVDNYYKDRFPEKMRDEALFRIID